MRLFKHTLLAFTAILAVAALFSACDKLDGLLSINAPLSADGINFIIPIDAHVGDTTISFPYTIKVDSLINAGSSQLSASNIKSLEIDSVTIAATSGTGVNNDFNNISAASVGFTSSYLPADTTTIATLPTTTDLAPTAVTNLVIPVNSSIDLKPYLDLTTSLTASTDLTFILHVTLRRAITTAIGCTANVHFIVRAGL